VQSPQQPKTTLGGGFGRGLYRLEGRSNLTVLLIDGTIDEPRQAVVIRMLWMPRAGRTPIDANATNATVHYLIFDGDDVGVYGGAGYLYPGRKPGRAKLKAGLWQANVSISDASEGFEDKLGTAMIEGRFTAERDDVQTRTAVQKLHKLIHERLGYGRMVLVD